MMTILMIIGGDDVKIMMINVWMYSMYACIYMYVYVYVCMYVYVYTH
jgi:hypothetical protein